MELQEIQRDEHTLQSPERVHFAAKEHEDPTLSQQAEVIDKVRQPSQRDTSGSEIFPLRSRKQKDSRLRSTIRSLRAVRWWREYIRPELIAQDETGHTIHDPRDFLALERTHLAYVRTSNAFALFGVTVTQLFILHDAGTTYGKAFATCAYAIAIYLTIVSGVRTIWLQDLLLEGRTATAYYTFGLVGALGISLLLAVFVVDILS